MTLAPPHLEPLGLAHLDILATLHARCFEKGWDQTALRPLLATPGVFGHLILDGTETAPVGFVLARSLAEACEILTIGVVPELRQSGHGTHLVNSVLTEAKRRGATSVTLEVADDNMAAIALYHRVGFSVVGRRPGYYRREKGRVDARIMRRDAVVSGWLSNDVHD